MTSPGAVRSQEQRAAGLQDAPKLAERLRDVVLADVLEHVVTDDEVERGVAEGKRLDGGDGELGSRHGASCQLDSLLAHVHADEPVEGTDSVCKG